MNSAVDTIVEATLEELRRIGKENGEKGMERWQELRDEGAVVTGIGQPPYGYTWKRILVLDEDSYEQGVQELQEQFFAANLSCQEVADALNSLGYLTRQGKPWNHVTTGKHRQRLGFAVFSSPKCEVENCPRQAYKEGFCGKHRYKFEKYGDPLAIPKKGAPMKSHCPQGHPYEGENLYIDPSGRRFCRICNREKVRRFYERHPEKIKDRKGKASPEARERANRRKKERYRAERPPLTDCLDCGERLPDQIGRHRKYCDGCRRKRERDRKRQVRSRV